MKTKSLEKEPMLIPGIYDALWTAYYVKILFRNGNRSHGIKLNNGVRGVNIECRVLVDDEGWVHVL